MKSPSLKASFGFAFNGLASVVKSERNMKIHLLVAVIIILAGYFLKVTRTEWLVLILVIGLVLTAETINTAIETMVDLVSPEFHPAAAKAKNIAAAAVLLAAFTAVIIGLLIFGTRIF